MRTRARWISIGAALILVAGPAYSAGCGTADQPVPGTDDGVEVANDQLGQAGWVKHQDPMGFAVQVPPGWKVSGDRSSGRVTVRGSGGVIVVWPVFMPATRLQSQAAPAVLRSLAMRLSPKAEWAAPTAVGPTAVRAVGQEADYTALATLAWTNSPEGAVGIVYLTSAPANRYPELETTFARILSGFRLVGTASEPARRTAAPMQYAGWLDPRENAFTIEVPRGWRVEGGMFRNHALEFAPALDITSPDGRIWISVGDPNLTGFTTPLPGWEAYYPEGSWYPLTQTGGRLLVRRYSPGAAFAADHVRNSVARRCAGLELVENRDRRDVVQAINDILARYAAAGLYRRQAAGEVSFRCTQNGEPMRGYHFATTQIVSQDGTTGVWTVTALYGYVASPEEEWQAQEALLHLVKSFALTEKWLRMQANVNAAAGAIIRETNEHVSRLISQSFEARQRVQGMMSERGSRARLGIEDLTDPVTGDPIRVVSGSNYYWADSRGKVLGTDTDTQPGVDFRQLVRLP